MLITALSPCRDHWGCCRKNIVPQRWVWLCTLYSKSSKRRVVFVTVHHKISLAAKTKTPGCVTHCKGNAINNSTLQKRALSQHLQTFNRTLRWGVDLQGVSNKLSVIVVSESCLFLLCVKLEAQAHSHLKLREMKCLYSSLWVLLGTREARQQPTAVAKMTYLCHPIDQNNTCTHYRD